MIFVLSCGGKKEAQEAARSAGWVVGCRADHRSYGLVYFCDNNYKQYLPRDFYSYLRQLDRKQPVVAVVPDLSADGYDARDLARAFSDADAIRKMDIRPIIVPKTADQLPHIPPDMLVGYSLPTKYGAAQYDVAALAGRRVHILGGDPGAQIACGLGLTKAGATVESLDSGAIFGAALPKKTRKVWIGGKWVPAKTLFDLDLPSAVAMSCRNMRMEWLLAFQSLPQAHTHK